MRDKNIDICGEKYNKQELYDCLNVNGVDLEISDLNDLVVPTLLSHLIFIDLENEISEEELEEYDLVSMVRVVSKMFDLFGDNETNLRLAQTIAKGNTTFLDVEEIFIGSITFTYPYYRDCVICRDTYRKIKDSVLKVYNINKNK